MRWEGSVTVVTGASRGIGEAVVRAAARRGAKVGLIARSEDDLNTLLASIGERGAVAPADVTDEEALTHALTSIAAELGPIDILVNNAGIGHYGAVSSTDTAVFEKLMAVNYYGTVYATKVVLPEMLRRHRGHIVNVASVAGRLGAPFESAYAASKFAVVGLTEALSVELSHSGVGVSMVNPGPVATEFFKARGHPYSRAFPRPIPASQVAEAVVRAVTDDRLEVTVPTWLELGVITRHIAPLLYRWGAARSFSDELAATAPEDA